MPLLTAAVAGGARATSATGWGHVSAVARAVFPWFIKAGPKAGHTLLQRTLMRWLLYSRMVDEEAARQKKAEAEARRQRALQRKQKRLNGGSNGPRVPSLSPGSPFRDDDLDFPRLMLAATPRTQSVGLTDPRVEADMAARARRAPAARAAAKAAVRAEKGYP